MNAASLILSRNHEIRRYASFAPRYAYEIQEMVDKYEDIYPHEKFDDCVKIVSSFQGKGDQFQTTVLDVKNLVAYGNADLTELERFVGSPLPLCLKEFYAYINECMLVLQYPIRIYSPATLIMVEKEIRETEKKAGFQVPDEVTLLRLAVVPKAPSCFALRRFISDGQWKMVVCTDELTAELQNDDHLWLPETCEDFDIWFSRIIESDAFPLAKGDPDLFRGPLAKRVY
jgi:hypothetical protein